MSGFIELACGPMFSGKTSWLLNRLHSLADSNKQCELLSFDKDSVSLKKALLQSHKGDRFMALTCSSLQTVAAKVFNADVIAIDNAHFFDNVADFADSLAKKGKHVLITALNSSFNMTHFPSVTALIPVVDSFIHLCHGKCQCGATAPFSKSCSLKRPLSQIHPHPDAFEPSCRKCHSRTASGNLVLFLGPMFAGKTTSMINHCRKLANNGENVLVLKYAKDVRYSDSCALVTHDGDSIQALPVHKLKDACPEISRLKPTVIGIDEGQFYADIDLARSWVEQGFTVLVSALSGTFERKAFDNVLDLIAVADSIHLLHSKCKCGNFAPYSQRLVASKEVELIGGADSYSPVCRKCFLF
ncbi:hypothetical protein P9112_005590 [Eukaryota sp. TZLM1-RC]